ncbi:MAG: nucleotidyltransferase domain-containing protein [Cellulosilyticaceae bacterium]
MVYLFPNKVDTALEILQYVSPLKQQEIKVLIEHVPECVEMLILFGSTITDCCRPMSDIDLLIIGNHLEEHEAELIAYRKRVKSAMDLLMMSLEQLKEAVQSDLPFYKEIYQKGIVIYEKSQELSRG